MKSTPALSKTLKRCVERLTEQRPDLGERAENWRQLAENRLQDRHVIVAGWELVAEILARTDPPEDRLRTEQAE